MSNWRPGLIDDLLDLTRISKGKVQLNFEVVDAHSLLHNALEICHGDIEQKHLTLRLDLAAQKVHLRADPARLQQIFWNLIKNAVKFTPKDGQISISTSNDAGGQLQVEIADTGAGIEAASLPKIFDAFEQGGQNEVRWPRAGSGDQQNASRSAQGNHQGGERWSESRRQVYGDASQPAQRRTKGCAARQAPTAHRQSMRILLVEDHEDTNRSLTEFASAARLSCGIRKQCSNPPSSSAPADQFDVLISDLGLPDGSGIDLIKKLNSARPVFGIALTGFGMEEDIRKSHEAGFKHHLVKPIDLNKLDLLIQQSPSAATSG